MLRIKCSRCGFILYEGRIDKSIDEILQSWKIGNTVRCPRCLKKAEVKQIIVTPNTGHYYMLNTKLIIDLR